MLNPVRNNLRSRGPSSPSSALAMSYPAEPGVAGLGSGRSSAWGSRSSSTSIAPPGHERSDNGVDVGQRQAEGLRDAGIDDFPFHNVKAKPQRSIGLARRTPAVLSKLKSVWQRSIGKSEGGGSGDAARHICHGIVQNAVDKVGGVLMGGGFDGLDAPALVHSHVDDDRTTLHELEVGSLDQMGCLGTREEHGPDHQVR